MANIDPSKGINIEQELQNLELYKYHPNGILNVSLNRLQDMLDGKVVIAEPSNPFTYLLETNSLNTAFAIQEFAMQSRKMYPRLANTDSDLYLHMSDYDFLGRFSEPSYANVVFNIMFNDFKTKAYYDNVQKEYVLKLPRHLKVLIGSYVYLLTSAVIIRLTDNGIADVRFENQDFNNIFPVKTNHINFVERRINQDETYLQFSLKLPEVDIMATEVPIDRTSVFKNSLVFDKNRQYYYFRAFFFKNDQWTEMLVTHTNEVYDIFKPTCIIKVLPTTNTVECHIPSIYINTNMVGSKVKFLVYTTMGKISVNFGDYQVSEFRTEYGDVFPEQEMDRYTQPIETITKVIYTTDTVDSGKNGMTLEELKDAVINNSIGDRQLPITEKQLTYASKQVNFNIVKNVDIVTNRMYKLETEIPSPLTRYPITKFNLDILEYKTTINDLRQGNNITTFNEHITVIPEGTMFRLDDGILKHISPQEATQIRELSGAAAVTAVNATNYLSVYYHYVLDTSGERTKLRAYDLTSPTVPALSFKEFNSTARIGVNTIQGNLFKSSNGYTLDLLGNLKKYTETIGVSNITPYIVYQDVSGATFYLDGFLYTTINEQPVFRFYIDTNYFIDTDNRLHISNFRDNDGELITVDVDLTSALQVIYTSDQIPATYVSSDIDNLITGTYLSMHRCVVTLENLTLRFGHYLERLYTAVHTSTGTFNYQLYEEDVPLRYTSTVYNAANEIVHEVGDIVYDDNNAPVIAHPAGSVKLNDLGLPVPVNELSLVRYLNLLFIDYRVLLTTPQTSIDYNKQIKTHITEVTIENAVEVDDSLLDNSEAFVVIPKTVGYVKIKTAGGERTLSSMQSFVVDVYVRYDVYNNINARNNISYTIVKSIDEYLYGTTVIKCTEVLNSLFTQLKEFVVSVSIPRFTELNEEYMELVDKNSRVSLGKTLTIETDGYNLKEAITVNFKLID